LYHAKNTLKGDMFKFVFADVRDKERMIEVCKGVDDIFHCAAMKHVPICEQYPLDAINTNISGTHNVIKACEGDFILISTDKAVNPINTMGKTKALAEDITLDYGHKVVRFGNVLKSRGSVVPLWEKQGKAGRQITITDKRMMRFFMTTTEAIDLIMWTYEHGRKGCIHIKDMEEKSILAMATQIALKYKTKVRETGIRPGEKLKEMLMTDEEKERSERIDDYILVKQ